MPFVRFFGESTARRFVYDFNLPLAPKWPIPVPFFGMNHQKSNFFTDIWYSSWRGCWGQPMPFFWKLVDKTQMCNPPEATRHHSQIKLLILLPLRAIYFRTFQCEIPCITTVKIHAISCLLKRDLQKIIRPYAWA